jgi:hypothetical protein
MNRREAIIAGAVSIAAAVPTIVNVQASPSENPEVEPIRALLKAHAGWINRRGGGGGGWINGRGGWGGGGSWVNGGGGGWVNRRNYGGGGSWINRW